MILQFYADRVQACLGSALPPRNHLATTFSGEAVAAAAQRWRGMRVSLPPLPPTNSRGELEKDTTVWISSEEGPGGRVWNEVVAGGSRGSELGCSPYAARLSLLPAISGSTPAHRGGQPA